MSFTTFLNPNLTLTPEGFPFVGLGAFPVVLAEELPPIDEATLDDTPTLDCDVFELDDTVNVPATRAPDPAVLSLTQTEKNFVSRSLLSEDPPVTTTSPTSFSTLEELVGVLTALKRSADTLGHNLLGHATQIFSSSSDVRPVISALRKHHPDIIPENLEEAIFQSSDPDRSIVEIIANALDAIPKGNNVSVTIRDGFYSVLDQGCGMGLAQLIKFLIPKITGKGDGSVTTGRFGVGAYTIFRHFLGDKGEGNSSYKDYLKEGSALIVETKTANEPARRLTYLVKDHEIWVTCEEIETDNDTNGFLRVIHNETGTRVSLVSKNLRSKTLHAKINQFLRYADAGKGIIVNKRRINPKEPLPEVMRMGDAILRINKNVTGSKIAIKVGDDVIIEEYSYEGHGLPGELVLELPKLTKLSIERQKIAVDADLITVFKKILEGMNDPEQFPDLDTKVCFLNSLSPMAKAFDNNTRNRTRASFTDLLRAKASELLKDKRIYPDSKNLSEKLSNESDSSFHSVASNILPSDILNSFERPSEFKSGIAIAANNQTRPLQMVLSPDLKTPFHYEEDSGVLYLSDDAYRNMDSILWKAFFKIPNLRFKAEWGSKPEIEKDKTTEEPAPTKTDPNPADKSDQTIRGGHVVSSPLRKDDPDFAVINSAHDFLEAHGLTIGDFWKTRFPRLDRETNVTLVHSAKLFGKTYLVFQTETGKYLYDLNRPGTPLWHVEGQGDKISVLACHGRVFFKFTNHIPRLEELFDPSDLTHPLISMDEDYEKIGVVDGYIYGMKVEQFRQGDQTTFDLFDPLTMKKLSGYPNTKIKFLLENSNRHNLPETYQVYDSPSNSYLVLYTNHDFYIVDRKTGKIEDKEPMDQIVEHEGHFFGVKYEKLFKISVGPNETIIREPIPTFKNVSILGLVKTDLYFVSRPDNLTNILCKYETFTGQVSPIRLLNGEFVLDHTDEHIYLGTSSNQYNEGATLFDLENSSHSEWDIVFNNIEWSQVLKTINGKPWLVRIYKLVSSPVIRGLQSTVTEIVDLIHPDQALMHPDQVLLRTDSSGDEIYFSKTDGMTILDPDIQIYDHLKDPIVQQRIHDLIEAGVNDINLDRDAIFNASLKGWELIFGNPEKRGLFHHLKNRAFDDYVVKNPTAGFLELLRVAALCNAFIPDGIKTHQDVEKLEKIIGSSIDIDDVLGKIDDGVETLLIRRLRHFFATPNGDLLIPGNVKIDFPDHTPSKPLAAVLGYAKSHHPKTLEDLAKAPQIETEVDQRTVLNATEHLQVGQKFGYLRGLVKNAMNSLSPTINVDYYEVAEGLHVSVKGEQGLTEKEIITDYLAPNKALFSSLKDSEWVRVKTAVKNSPTVILLEFKKRSDGHFDMAWSKIKNTEKFSGTLVEVRSPGNERFLEASDLKFTTEELGKHLPPPTVFSVKEKVINAQNKPPLLSIFVDDLGQVELFDGASNGLLLGGLLLMQDLPASIWNAITPSIRTFIEKEGIYINLVDEPNLPLTTTGDQFRDPRVLEKLGRALPGLIIRTFLERVKNPHKPDDLAHFPEVIFIEAYKMLSDITLGERVLIDAGLINEGKFGEVDYSFYNNEKALIKLLTLVEFISDPKVPGKKINIREVFNRLEQNDPSLKEIIPHLPPSLKSRIELAYASKNQVDKAQAAAYDPNSQNSIESKRELAQSPFAQAYLDVVQELACYFYPGDIKVVYDLSPANAWASAFITKRYGGVTIHLPLTEYRIREIGILKFDLLLSPKEGDLSESNALADLIQIITHELTHALLNQLETDDITHDPEFYDAQMELIFGYVASVLDLKEILEIHVIKFKNLFVF